MSPPPWEVPEIAELMVRLLDFVGYAAVSTAELDPAVHNRIAARALSDMRRGTPKSRARLAGWELLSNLAWLAGGLEDEDPLYESTGTTQVPDGPPEEQGTVRRLGSFIAGHEKTFRDREGSPAVARRVTAWIRQERRPSQRFCRHCGASAVFADHYTDHSAETL